MLQRVTMQGIELPRLYIAENRKDVELAIEKGVPFVRWKQGKEKLIKLLLLPTLKKMFPHILWNKLEDMPKSRSIIVEKPPTKTKVSPVADDPDYHASTDHKEITKFKSEEEEVLVDVATDYRSFDNDGSDAISFEKIDIYQHMGDLSSQVNLDVLQNLKLMPKFVGDILDCIKTNMVAGTMWSEGYNKKKAATVGNYDRSGELRNLIIVDISGSIPIGISSTMITLVDTLRSQVHADLIITGSCSRYYPYEEELPDPQTIRDTIGRSNEAMEFCAILLDHIVGRHWGHVISFGDNDNPGNWIDYDSRHYGLAVEIPSLASTEVEHVHHYHTGCGVRFHHEAETGYALWTNELSKKPVKSFYTNWCNVIER